MITVFRMAVFIGILFSAGAPAATEYAKGRWVDLTHEFSEETIYWPTADGFEHETVFEGVTEKGFYYTAYNFCAAEHGGTHIDAPIHFAKGRWSVEEIPLDQLIGPAAVIDVSRRTLENRDYQVRVSDVTDWEEKHGRLPEGGIVLLHTGFGRYWPDREKYMGTAQRGPDAIPALHFPGLHPETAKWLVENRRIKAVGLDTPSIDYGQSVAFESHRILFEKNIPAFENVANLDKVPPTGATVLALPMKIKGGSGGPVRIAAFIPGAAGSF